MLKLIEFNESNLYFKKLMNEDCDTMSYNAGYDLDFPGYDKQTGAIYKSDSDYLVWLQKWQGKSDRAVYIIVRESDNEFIGEVWLTLVIPLCFIFSKSSCIACLL